MAEEKDVTLNEGIETVMAHAIGDLDHLEVGSKEYLDGVRALKDLNDSRLSETRLDSETELRERELSIREEELAIRREELYQREVLAMEERREKRRDRILGIVNVVVKVVTFAGAGAGYVYLMSKGIDAEDKAVLFTKATSKVMTDAARFASENMKVR